MHTFPEVMKIMRSIKTPVTEGWFLKQQGENGTLIFIPCRYTNKPGGRTAALRVITPEGMYDFGNLFGEFSSNEKRFCVQIGESVFSDHGCRLDIREKNIRITGTLWYGLLKRPHYGKWDTLWFFMGRGRRRRIISWEHAVNGKITINGKEYLFRDGIGYAEEGRAKAAAIQNI